MIFMDSFQTNYKTIDAELCPLLKLHFIYTYNFKLDEAALLNTCIHVFFVNYQNTYNFCLLESYNIFYYR